MSFFDFASRMFPYWCFGALMGWAVWKSDYKDLLAFNRRSFGKFFLFMCFVSVYRYFMLHLLIKHGMGSSLGAVKNLPIGATAFVFWEDLCHALPLVLLRRMIGTRKWTWPIHGLCTAIVMGSFLLGHLYQGIFAAVFISLYIPFSVSFGQKKGFGTLIGCHMLYDFCTLMTVKMVLG